MSYTDYMNFWTKTAGTLLTDFANSCHDPETGRFCEGTGTGTATQHPSPGADLGIMSSTDKKRFRDVLGIIASIHTLPADLPNARVQLDPKLDRNTGGVYSEDSGLIRINPLDLDTMGQLNFIHEFGHHLTLADGGLIYPTDSHASKLGTKFLEKLGQSDLGNWYYQTVQSKAFNRQFQREGQNDDYVSYLKNPKELFARSYTQWIVSHSNNPQLKAQFNAWRSRGETSDIQWTDQDFAPISKALDEYFSAKHLTASAAPTTADRRAALVARLATEFANPCHSPDTGQFCETEGGAAASTTTTSARDLVRNIRVLENDHTYGGEEVAAALDAINSVHSLPANIDRVRIEIDHSGKLAAVGHEQSNGLYQPDIKTGDGTTKIFLNAAADELELTAVHEFGHYIDHKGHLLWDSQWATSRTGDPPMQAFQDAIRKSPQFEALTRNSFDKSDEVKQAYSKYLLAPRELFARAYAQYIATRSGNETLKTQLGNILAGRSNHLQDGQWDEKSFAPIATAMDSIFARKDLLTKTPAPVTASANPNLEFANPCHDAKGEFCETAGGQKLQRASTTEQALALKRAKAKIRNAPVPSKEDVVKHRAALLKAEQEGARHGGEFRGNSTDRHRRQLALWKEFGGPEKGYITDAATGVKMSWTKDPKENPLHLPTFTQGKIWTAHQGGSYRLEWLLPELLQSNQARGDTPVRKENLEALVAAASITEFYNDCHDPSTGEFCGGNFPPESYVRPFPQVTEEFHQADRTFVSRLTAPEKEMIREYASVGDYKALNSGTNQIGARLLDEAIAKAPELSHPVRVYRGVMFNSAEKRQQALDEIQTSLESQQPIKIGPEHGFQSTSVNTEYPMGIAGTSSNPGFMFEVMSKRGAPVGSLGTPGEEELLIGRDEKFRVVAIQPQARFQTRLGVSRPIYTVQVEQL